jgi:predicted nucleotidyltransferase
MDIAPGMSELSRRDLLPADLISAFVVGSAARGWDNAGSDVDLYVVAAHRWDGRVSQDIEVRLDPPTVLAVAEYLDGRRWEVKHWLPGQIDQVIGKVDRPVEDAIREEMTETELLLLVRLPSALPVRGAAWLRERQDRLRGSAIRSVLVSRLLSEVDIRTEDTVGMLDSGDVTSALISVKRAFARAVDALLTHHGELMPGKWRARAMREHEPVQLSFAEYWSIETMAEFDADKPAQWVERVLELCQRICLEVRL